MINEAKAASLTWNEAFRQRTQAAALRVIKLYQQLPRWGEAETLGKQLLRAATSVAANYRASCRARSSCEYYAKRCICVEEADETQFWLELLGQAGIFPKVRLSDLEQEYAAITAILTTARKLAKQL
ncbi:four helix bundle protein [Hymenobacter baengnokdamensis]|uniref:four helix bundle protein n=1 Tax=Hymenobacter baengnokdamensis TaxID=2615203 RepID=UPI001244238E|nr:four helix bundle protein [Hymenobacter baengnokdamensis]